MRRWIWAYVALVGLAGAQLAVYLPQMPPEMAGHFDVSGQPDAWFSRSTMAWVHVGALLVSAGLLALVAALLPRTPDRWISIPHRDHWLSPARRAASLVFVQDALHVLGVASGLLVVAVFQLVVAWHLQQIESLRAVVPMVAGYFVLVAVVTVRLFRRFKR